MGEDKYTVRGTAFVTAGSGLQAVLKPDPMRVGLIISIGASIASTSSAALGWGGDPLRFALAQNTYQLWKFSDVGPLVAGAWGIDTTGIGLTAYFAEILLLPGK